MTDLPHSPDFSEREIEVPSGRDARSDELPKKPFGAGARLWVASALTYIASRIAPPEMAPVFQAYAAMLDDFGAELQKARTFGVASAVWGYTPEDRLKAAHLRSVGTEAITKERAAMNARLVETRPKGTQP